VTLFSVEDRERVRARVLELAEADERVVAGATIGSLAVGGDRWSDLDLTFGVDGSVAEVLEDWTRTLESELDAVHLFDLPRQSSIYRVFLLPGCLQFDLSFTPALEFGARGPKFQLLFGKAVQHPAGPEPSPEHLFGMAVHHALRARFTLERAHLWQSEFWISWLRDDALALACRKRGLQTEYGRGFDDLPPDVLERFTLVRSLDRDELLRALRLNIDALLGEWPDPKVEARLRDL
jgi:hypothetical protein